MKILLDARAVSSQPHGIGRYVVDLFKGLTDAGHEVSLIYTNSTVPPSLMLKNGTSPDVFVMAQPFAHPLNPFSLALLNIKWNLNKFDIIHFPSFSLPLSFAPLPWGKVVVTIHDTIHLLKASGSRVKRVLFWMYYFLFVLRPLHKARAVIAVSQWTAEQIYEWFGVPKERIFTVRNGLDPIWFEPISLALKPERKYFVCLANTKPHKNLGTLIHACKDLWAQGLEFDLRISGTLSDQNDEKIKAFCKLPEDELRHLIAGATALISTSLVEGFNYPIAEALALGTAVIASNIPAHLEFNSPLVRFYGEPMDQAALKTAIIEALNKNLGSTGKTPPHGISPLSEMVHKTLNAYGKTRGL